MYRSCLHLTIGLALLTACSADDMPDAPCGSLDTAGTIAFDASAPGWDAAARGTVTDLANLGTFAVSATVTDSDSTSVYFAHETYSASSQASQTLAGKTYYWLDKDAKYSFYAYSKVDNASFPASAVDRFDFVVSDDVASQQDILVCAVIDAPYSKMVPLRFSHPLSRITVSQGSAMAKGRIQSVSFSGVVGKGSYDIGAASWTFLPADSTTYTYRCDMETSPGASVTGSQYNFFFIPQTFTPKTAIHITFVDVAGAVHHYSKTLTGQWKAGVTYNYAVSVTPSLDFVLADTVADAHYSIVSVGVKAPDIPATRRWCVKASASDGADVSVQWLSDVNKFARQGFWTDSYIADGVKVSSARGTETTDSVTGPYTSSLCLFLPENASKADRVVTLAAVSGADTLAVASIRQKCPAYAGSLAWEQIQEDNSANFGFDWDRSLAYVFPYSVCEYGLLCDFSRQDALTILDGVISLGGASHYADLDTYYRYVIDGVGPVWHYYLDINYYKCDDLAAGSLSNGLLNTSTLNAVGGTAATGAFEMLVKNTCYQVAGGTAMLRLPSSQYSQEDDVPRAKGVADMTVSALGHVLKKNRFNYVVRHVGDAVVEYPSLSSADLKWYLPAVGQFKTLPSGAVDPVEPARCWSSSAVAGSTSAYLGSGVPALRSSLAGARACRTAE